MKNKILIFAPHGDDEVLGCGGSMVRWSRAGHEIAVCYMTGPHNPEWTWEYIQQREIEYVEASKLFGFRPLPPAFKAGQMDTVRISEVVHFMRGIIEAETPDMVVLPFRNDVHQDHRITFMAGLIACRPHRAPFPGAIMEMEIPSETEWGATLGRFNPNYYLVLTGAEMKRKIAGLRIYAGEMKDPPHPRSINRVLSLAHYRGSEVCENFAEGFHVVRIVECERDE